MVKQFLLEEVAKIIIGKTFTNDKCFTSEGTPFITKETLKNILKEDDISQIPKVGNNFIEQFNISYVPAKSILLNKLNLMETTIYQCKKDVCIGQDIMAIIPNESIIESDYLFHFFKWCQVNKEKLNIYRLIIDLPPIEIQMRVVQLLNAIQHLLSYTESLVTAVEKLPEYFHNITNQTKQHSNNLHQGFEMLQLQYIEILHKVFNGEFLNAAQKYDFLR
ncbi:restriction endonuclease subunit S [Lysinibacillus cavernae]|uniref:restriction endonuclease subunit S n=1 Tax=Lysinibacillus cavernae TaxID=2666135 RepID=UPI0012D92969|nr:restriction endonuclease subunit S [Lysinibacillus cavernae]